jgi:tripartite-type tricarboxylate transporter receptor subunit TctC
MFSLALRTCAAALAAALVSPAGAQEYPAKPIRVTLPWPPGGPTDVIGRLMVQKLTEILGQPMVIDNRAGASGMIGSELVAKAAPDGYTLLLNSGSTQIVYGGLFKSLSFDPINDFAAVANIGSSPVVVVAHPSLQPKNMGQLISYARANPGALNLAIPGEGTLPHLLSELVNGTAKIRMTMIPYKGTPPALNDVLGGQTHLTYVSVATALPLIQAKRLQPLGISSPKRLAALADVPTLSESGLPGMHGSTWYGLWAPKGTPERIVQRVNAAVVKAAEDRTLRARYAESLTELEVRTPAAFTKFFSDESGRWLKVMRDAGVRPQ